VSGSHARTVWPACWNSAAQLAPINPQPMTATVQRGIIEVVSVNRQHRFLPVFKHIDAALPV